MKPLPADPREKPNQPWTLEQLENYEPVAMMLSGEFSLSAIADQFEGLTQPQLSHFLNYVRELAPEKVPERFAKRKPKPRPSTRVVHTYPVYGKVQAGHWNHTDVVHDEQDIGTYYTTRHLPSVGGVEPYALEVKGLSMTNERASVQFPEGSKVLVSPGRNNLRAGDFVVAFDEATQETTLKRYAVFPEGPMLMPLNPDFPNLPVGESHRIAGVVIEAMLPLYERPEARKVRKGD